MGEIIKGTNTKGKEDLIPFFAVLTLTIIVTGIQTRDRTMINGINIVQIIIVGLLELWTNKL